MHKSVEKTDKQQYAVLTLLVLGGLGLRLWAARDEFWLDEIGSLLLYAQRAVSPIDIFIHMRESNNHHLMTLWMYLCGNRGGWMIYRIPSIVGSVATSVLAAWICSRWGNAATAFVTCLTSLSFVLITYGSEARGYALAGLFALCAYLLLERCVRRNDWQSAVGFGLVVLLGFLAHLTFIFFYAGALVWSLVRVVRTSPNFRSATVRVLRCHAPALVAVTAFWACCLRGYVVGGAPDYSTVGTALGALSVAAGGPIQGQTWAMAVGLCAAGIGIAAIALLARARDDHWVLFGTSIFVAPAAFVALKPSALIERFFYVSIVMLMLLWSCLFAWAWKRGRASRAAAIVLLAISLLGNGYQTAQFLKVGRGHFGSVLRRLESEAVVRDAINVKSDDAFRAPLYAEFYVPRAAPWLRIRFEDFAGPGQADWVLLSTSQHESKVPPTLRDPAGTTYGLDRVERFAGLSGLNWVLYRRLP